MASKRPTFPQVKTALDLKYIWYLTKTIRSKVYESVRVCEKRGVCRYGQCYNPICGQISCWKTKKQMACWKIYHSISFLKTTTTTTFGSGDLPAMLNVRLPPPCCYLKSMEGDRLARSLRWFSRRRKSQQNLLVGSGHQKSKGMVDSMFDSMWPKKQGFSMGFSWIRSLVVLVWTTPGISCGFLLKIFFIGWC